MAKQSSIITLNGKVGGISFYKTKEGYFAREKGGVSKSRIMSDPRFARTRENIQEFKENIQAVKLLQDTNRPATIKVSDPKLHQRLVRQMMAVVKSDETGARGERKVANGNWDLLQGMELNGRASLGSTLRTEFSITNTPVEWGVSILPFLPTDYLAIPEGSTHFRIFCGASAIDTLEGSRAFAMETTEDLPLAVTTGMISLTIQKNLIPHPLRTFIVGIEFLQLVNGTHYAINNGSNNAAAFVATEKA